MSSLQNNHSVLVCRWLCMHSFTLCYFFSQFLHTRYINLILLGFLLLWQAFPLSLLLPVLLLSLCSLSKCRAAPKPSCSPPAEYSVYSTGRWPRKFFARSFPSEFCSFLQAHFHVGRLHLNQNCVIWSVFCSQNCARSQKFNLPGSVSLTWWTLLKNM